MLPKLLIFIAFAKKNRRKDFTPAASNFFAAFLPTVNISRMYKFSKFPKNGIYYLTQAFLSRIILLPWTKLL
jgi:hypothetical protein